MSKQSDAKNKQNYIPRPKQNECSNCANFTSDISIERGYYGVYQKEKNLRCSIGGFKVLKRGKCDEHKPSEETK